MVDDVTEKVGCLVVLYCVYLRCCSEVFVLGLQAWLAAVTSCRGRRRYEGRTLAWPLVQVPQVIVTLMRQAKRASEQQIVFLRPVARCLNLKLAGSWIYRSLGFAQLLDAIVQSKRAAWRMVRPQHRDCGRTRPLTHLPFVLLPSPGTRAH